MYKRIAAKRRRMEGAHLSDNASGRYAQLIVFIDIFI